MLFISLLCDDCLQHVPIFFFASLLFSFVVVITHLKISSMNDMEMLHLFEINERKKEKEKRYLEDFYICRMINDNCIDKIVCVFF